MKIVFSNNLTNKILPGLTFCDEIRRECPTLRNGNAPSIKASFNNYLKEQKRIDLL